MTQEEHLECSHQISNPVNDQVNDDSEKSKNIAASNQANAVKSNITNSRGIESVDEAHVLDDKDRVRGSGLDLKASNENRSVVKISEVKVSDKNNNNLKMTVITHQGSGENIREIQTKIENSEKILNNSPDTVGGVVGDRIENGEFQKPTESVNTSENNEKKEIPVDSNEIKLSSKISDNSEKSKITNTTSQSDSKANDEDPFARLRALRANISNALREVKAVLSEHGEATNEPKEENEEIKPTEDNAIRFRFVRRIRKKSSFDETSANKFQSENIKESTGGEIKDILEIDKESLVTSNNLVQKKLEHVEESLSILQPDQAKQADPSANAISKDESTHLLAVQDEIVDNLSSNTNNTVIENKQITESQETTIPPDYRITIIESQGIIETGQETIATEATKLEDKKILTEDKLIASKNTFKPESKNEPFYRVNVVESVAEENEKLAASTLVENKEVSTGDKNKKETSEPHYIVKVVEVESGATPIEIENNTPKKTDSKKRSIKDARESAEKPQGKVKTKLASNQTKPIKPKVGAKSNSEKNETSDEKPKNKKTKSEVEVGKKSKRSSKEISKTEALSLEKSKSSSSTIKNTKSKSKKESVTPSEKTEIISEQGKMPLVPVPSKDIVSATPKTISLVPVNDLVSVSSKTEIMLKSEKLEPTSTKNINPVPVPQKCVIPMESTQEAPITTNEQIPIENKKVQDQILSNQAPAKHKADKTVQIEEKKVPILKEEKEPLAGQENISTNGKVSLEKELSGPIQVKSISKQSQELIESSKTTDIKIIELSKSILQKPLPNTGKREETLSDHAFEAVTGSLTKNKMGPTSALEKVLATTNFKLLPEARPSLPCEKPSTTELINVPIKSSPSDMSRISSSHTEMEKHQTEIQNLSSTASAANDAAKLTITTTKTTTSLSTNEKITSKSETNKTSNQHINVVEEKNNHDVNTNKNLDSPLADENLKLERKPVDKSKLSLKIESNKIGTAASRLTLTQLQSPTKAVQLVSSKLDVVPVSKPSQILIKDISPKEDRALIISQSNESQSICDENITHDDNTTTKLEEKSEEIINEQEDSIGEQKSPEEEKIHKEKGNTTKKRKMKKKVVIRRLKRRLSTDGTVPGRQDSIESAEPEICEKEIKLNDPEPIVEPEPIPEEEKLPPGPKSCIKKREFQPGDIVLYNDRIKKIAKWKKANVIERITSISYKLDIEGEEKSCHICYIKKFTDKKVQFGAKEYLEIDYAEDEDEEEEEYNIWARV